MTVLEFESWVSEHYDELVELSKVLCRSNRATAADTLHAVVEHVLEAPERVEKVVNPIAWFNRAITLRFYSESRDTETATRRTAGFAAEVRTLGLEDAYTDAARVKLAHKQRNHDARRRGKQAPTQLGVNLVEAKWDGPMPGVARWRFQTLRDDRLFIKRAIASQAESIWAAVKRQAHGLERGNSYTEFGLEASK